MKKQLHIIVKYFYPVAAGIETNIMETFSHLTHEWDITVHTSKDTLTEKNTLPEKENYRGFTIKRYRYSLFGYFPHIAWEKADVIAMHNFNIVPHLYLLVYTLFLKLIRKKTYTFVLTPHGGFTPEWRIFSKISALLKKTYHYTIGTLLINLSVDKLRAVSEWEKDQIISKGVKKNLVMVIPNGVEDEAYKNIDALAGKQIKQQVASYGKYILQIGRIYKIKNYETTIRALAKIKDDVKYVIAGPVQDNTNYLNTLKDLINSLGLQNRVVFLGVVRGIDKYYLIKHAQMMVHMALWESFCNVVHEGLSQGLVCIVANNTALPYLIKDGVHGYCIDTMDDKALSEKIQFVLKNKKNKIIKDMEERNKKYGLEYSWKKVSIEVHSYYLS